MPRGLVALVLLVVWVAPLFADDAVAVARTYVLVAYDGRFEQLPKAPGADTERFERRVRNMLRVRCVHVEGITLEAVNETELLADVAITKTDSEQPALWSETDVVPLRIRLARAGDGWAVSSVRNRDEELAELLSTAAPADRERLLTGQGTHLSKGVGRALHERAIALLNKGEFQQAADALHLARGIAAAAGDRGGEALAAIALIYTPGMDVALLRAEVQRLMEGVTEPDVLARLWYDLGRTTARSYWEVRAPQQVAYRIECSHKTVRHAARAEDPTLMVRALGGLGGHANAQGDYVTARRYIDRALALARASDDRISEMGLETTLATIYFEQGDHERGLFHHGRALAIAEELQVYAYPALLLRNGLILAEVGRYEEARAAFDRILTRDGNRVVAKFGKIPRSTIGSALRSQAVIEAERGNLAEAECLMRESSVYYDASHAYLYELAPYHLRRGDAAAALSRSLASLSDSSSFTNVQKVSALLAASRAYRALVQPAPALQTALEAIEIGEAFDSRIAGDERQQAQASRLLAECYDHAAELALEAGDVPGALAFLENGRARVLTQIIDHGRAGATAEADAQLDEEQAALERELVRISVELDRASGAARAPLAERLRQARAAHASFVDGRRARSERRRASRRRLDPSAIPPGVAAIEYLVTERRLHLFVAGHDRVIHRTVDVDQGVLDQRVRTFVQMLAERDLRVEAAARDVYALLFEPIEADLAGRRAVVVVPDKVLWSVPFAALIDRRGQYLAERFAIAYAPSIAAYTAMSEPRRERKHEAAALLAVGNPTIHSSARQDVVSHYRDVTLGPLPDAEHEVDSVGTLYGARRVVLKRAEATETRVKSALPSATVVHFATHAILDDANPMYSRLALAGRTAEEDGWLESWEVARLRLQADIVVLSACDTARGRVAGGEGVIGLTWAFFVAGARSTVATHWKIPSSSTADLMIAFHRRLRAPRAESPLPKAEALRQAQLALLRDPRTRHPFHWAGVILLGNP